MSRPTVSATAPPTPASTSSKISVCAVAEFAGGDGDRQRDARELAARGDLADGPRRAAGMAGDQERERLQTMWAGLRRAAAERDLEAAALHAEPLHRLRDRLRELRRGLRARPCDSAVRPVHVGWRVRCSARSSAARSAAASSSRQLLPSSSRAAPAARRAALVAARQRHPVRHALVEFGQPLRIELGLAQVGIAANGAASSTCARLEASTSAMSRNSGSRCSCPCSAPCAAIRPLRPPPRRLRCACSAPCAASSSAWAWDRRVWLALRLVPLVVAGRELVDFADLPGQPLAFALQRVLRRARVGQRLLRGAPALPELLQRLRCRRPHSASSSARTASGRVRLCQACWPWMSTSCSPSSRNCVAVAALPLIQARLLPWLSMRAAQQQACRRASKPASSSQGASAGGGVELGADLGARRAFAHHAGIGARAQRELQRIDQDRLAGAGLAGQHA